MRHLLLPLCLLLLAACGGYAPHECRLATTTEPSAWDLAEHLDAAAAGRCREEGCVSYATALCVAMDAASSDEHPRRVTADLLDHGGVAIWEIRIATGDGLQGESFQIGAHSGRVLAHDHWSALALGAPAF